MVKFGLLGEKLGHSHSPKLQQDIMKEKKIQGTYEAMEVSPDDFEGFFLNLKKSEFLGVNITLPYKETVLPLLDEISAEAKYIGAVNTVLFKNGKAKGYNTDYDGFIALLALNNVKIKGENAIILGAGGVSKAVCKALLDLGICDLTVVSRSKQRFHNQYTVSYEFFQEGRVETDLLINCTPVGMYPHVSHSPLAKKYMNTKTAIDVIYNPKQTLFLKYAAELGITGINGSEMLLAQARAAQEIWNAELTSEP